MNCLGKVLNSIQPKIGEGYPFDFPKNIPAKETLPVFIPYYINITQDSTMKFIAEFNTSPELIKFKHSYQTKESGVLQRKII